MHFHNYNKETLQKVHQLSQGFILSYDSNNEVVLSIKTTTGSIDALVRGCPIILLLTKNEMLVTLYIIDNKDNPLYYRGNCFSELDNRFENFEKIIIDLIQSTSFRLIILNEANYQIVNSTFNKNNSINIFTKWIENEDREFKITLCDNFNFLYDKKVIYIDADKNEIWERNLINNKSYFDYNEYLKNGTHGYNQEFSTRTILSKFYQPNLELFSSLKKINKEEFSDFLIIYNNAILIIESKYTLSTKQTKFNDAIVKAIKQLNTAEEIIIKTPSEIDNEYVVSKTQHFPLILKICIFYDDGRNLTKAFKNISDRYNIEILPIFISINILNQFMSYSKIQNDKDFKYNIIRNLLELRKKFVKIKEVVIIDGFDINTGAIKLIN